MLPAMPLSLQEIVHDVLSQVPELGNRVEVRDVDGSIRSVLFYPTHGSLDFDLLEAGHVLLVRYAKRAYFSDLAVRAFATWLGAYYSRHWKRLYP